MIVKSCQRWRAGRASYRSRGEVLDPRRYDVELIATDNVARAFVIAHHYSQTYPAARRRVGLYRDGDLVGVAVFSVPVNARTITNVLDVRANDAVELGRFVLLDEVPANGESWFLARCFELLRREGFAGVVSFSDPMERLSHAGEVVFAGHIGTIYQATNARYLGLGTARSLRLLPDGAVFSARAQQKIRKRECGHRAAARILERFGVDALTEHSNSVEWLRDALACVTRCVRHSGNHKYAWSFGRRKHWSSSALAQPYPKLNTSARQRALFEQASTTLSCAELTRA